jgi:hypothetical protein
MGYSDPETIDRINRAADRLDARLKRAEEVHAQARERLDQERASRIVAEREQKSAIQAKADELFSKFGEAPPRPIADESPRRYRKRVIHSMQEHLAPGDPFSLIRQPNLTREADATLDVLEPRVRESFAKAVHDPATVAEGTFREIHSTDAGGHKVSSFIGRRSFIHDMVAPVFKVVGGVNGGLRRNAEMNSSRSR